jgi:MFS family permease
MRERDAWVVYAARLAPASGLLSVTRVPFPELTRLIMHHHLGRVTPGSGAPPVDELDFARRNLGGTQDAQAPDQAEGTRSRIGGRLVNGPISMRRVVPLYLVVFAGFVGYSLMIAIFTPLLLRADGGMLPRDDSLAVRTIVLGIVLALYPLAQFLAAPVIGGLSDRFGRRPTLLVSLAASTGCYAVIAVAVQSRSLALLMAGCLLAGLAEANIAVAQSAIADVAPANQRSRLFGYVYLSSSLAYVVGPLAGGRLADRGLVSWFDYATPFWATLVLLACVLAVTAALFRETATPGGGGDVRLSRALMSLADAFRPNPLRRLYLANFLLYLAVFGFFRAYPMYLVDRFHMTVSRESLFVAWVAVPIVVANAGVVSWLARRMTPLRTLTLGSGALAIAIATIVIPQTEGPLWVTLAATALVIAICLPAAATIISQASPADQQGSALGSNQSLQVGAEAAAGLGGGLLAAITDVLPLSAMAALAVAACLRYRRCPTSRQD